MEKTAALTTKTQMQRCNSPASHPLVMSHYLWNHIVKEAVFDRPGGKTAFAITSNLISSFPLSSDTGE